MPFRGFTLIELLIGVAIFAFLIMLAGPMYATFMANSQIRNASEAMLNGVQQAQAAAVRGNTLARLVIDKTTGTGGWQVLQTIDGGEPSPPNPVQIYTVRDGAPNATITPAPGDARQITFDGFGRIVPNVDASATLTCIKVTHSLSGTRPLNLSISNPGIGVNKGTKLCDPDPNNTLPLGDPMTCPASCK
jgi:type IV fimbrial biogenesis protein FimT